MAKKSKTIVFNVIHLMLFLMNDDCFVMFVNKNLDLGYRAPQYYQILYTLF